VGSSQGVVEKRLGCGYHGGMSRVRRVLVSNRIFFVTVNLRQHQFWDRFVRHAGGAYIALVAMCAIKGGGPWPGRRNLPGSKSGSLTTATGQAK
jgi:hypothetical protein